MTWACLSPWRRGWDRQESGSFRRGLVTNEEDPTRGSCSDKRQSPRQRQTRVSGCLLSRSNLERVRIETRGSTNNCLLIGQRSFYFRECERARRVGLSWGCSLDITHKARVWEAHETLQRFITLHLSHNPSETQRDSVFGKVWKISSATSSTSNSQGERCSSATHRDAPIKSATHILKEVDQQEIEW